MSKYSEKFKDPRWQKIRLKILERDEWNYQKCNDTETTLHIHHRYYKKNKEPWEYPLDYLVTLCEDCHKEEEQIRSGIEKSLLFSLRKNFFAEEVSEITIGFECIAPIGNQPCVLSAAFGLALSNKKIQRIVVDSYWREIEIKNLKQEIEVLEDIIKGLQ